MQNSVVTAFHATALSIPSQHMHAFRNSIVSIIFVTIITIITAIVVSVVINYFYTILCVCIATCGLRYCSGDAVS